MLKDIEIINQKSNIAVCTLWTKKDQVISALPEKTKEKIGIVGTLYTKPGINYMLETLGEENNIDTLIVYGADMSESGNGLVEVFIKKNLDSLKIDKDKVKEIINTVKIIDLREDYRKNNLDALIHSINNNYKEMVVPKRNKLDLKVEEEVGVASYPYSVVNQRIYETSVFNAWIKILDIIYKYGSLKFSEYGESQKEIINMMVTIDLRGKEYEIEKEFLEIGFSKKDFEKHIKEVLTSEKPKGVEYTYGERLRKHKYGKDQIDFIIEKLSKTPYSRRCVGVTWDHENDMKTSHPPCIISVQGIITDNYYHHTCFIRSNDMVRGWPINIVGQIKLAEYIVKKINEKAGTDYKVGTVTTISVSAHIYEHDFNYVKDILQRYNNIVSQRFVQDPTGNILIRQDGTKIVIEHRTPDNMQILDKREFGSFKEAYEYIKGMCTAMLPQHALYLGKEIQKAFDVIKRGEKYIQDSA